jgi:hypothetical protein
LLTFSACPPPDDQTYRKPPPEDNRPVIPDRDPKVPEAVAAVVADNPTAPADNAGTPLTWPTAPELTPVQVAVNRDSAVLVLPAVAGAKDYRAFTLAVGTTVTTAEGGGEQVVGTTVYCAGFRQHNAKNTGVDELLRQLEVAGLMEPSRVVVEAIDAPCPFPGALGKSHAELQVSTTEVPAADRVAFSVFSAAEIAQRYGSLIVNGHRPGPTLAAPAEPTHPKVLARTTVIIEPKGRDKLPMKTFFDDFDGDDPPTAAGAVDDGDRAYADGRAYENARWWFLAYNAGISQPFIERGQLHMTLADWSQHVFGTMVAIPKRPAKLSDTEYLRIGFEVASNATARRYWWISLCGAEVEGQTMDKNGVPRGRLVQTPFFYQTDGKNPSVEGWNCLQFFPRDGSPFALPPTNTRPESDVRVMVNLPNRPDRDNVVNVSPPQYGSGLEKPGWFRQRDASGNLVAPILDDQMLLAPRTRIDAYVRRDRLILYVNGEQRLCNDFPTVKLTMAEGMIGFGQVLYHSSAERVEFSRSYNDRTGQRYYLTNTPYVDARSWDNLGYEELATAPASFDATKCYVHP